MKKNKTGVTGKTAVQNGYNEKTPSAPQGAFPPASASERSPTPGKNAMKKANTADKRTTVPEKKSRLKND
jgi:hypothetical protein